MDSLYYVTTTLTTVGYNPPANLTDEGKLFIVVFLAVGILVIGLTLGQLAEKVLNRQILDALGRRRDRRLEKLSGHWIVCGLGRVGLSVAEAIAEENLTVVVLDIDESKLELARKKGGTPSRRTPRTKKTFARVRWSAPPGWSFQPRTMPTTSTSPFRRVP